MKEIIRASYVIGRRDFTAIIFSKAFIFFLLGPLFPLIVGIAAGALGGQVARDSAAPVIGLAMSAEDTQAIMTARDALSQQLGKGRFPDMKVLAVSVGPEPLDPRALLQDKRSGLAAVYSGSLSAPVITGTQGSIRRWQGEMALLTGYANSNGAMTLPDIERDIVQKSSSDAKQIRVLTGQAAQTLLFMLTMLLAGMVLSNLVEEKSNKIIEILAAAIPIDAVFIGKLFAMLAMAVVGICVWFAVGFAGAMALGGGMPSMPEPAVGWPIFFILAVIYFTMAYLMLGSLFLGIGAQAATVREVQTLSMPTTMMQLVIFFFAMYTVTKIGQPIEQVASIFPFSSPFAMIARAAQVETLWHHGVAIVGQGLFALLILRISVWLFRRNVMKSGKKVKKDTSEARKLFGLFPVGR